MGDGKRYCNRYMECLTNEEDAYDKANNSEIYQYIYHHGEYDAETRWSEEVAVSVNDEQENIVIPSMTPRVQTPAQSESEDFVEL